MPKNIMVVPHGARVDKNWNESEILKLKEELGLSKIKHLSNNLVGLVGWIQSNKRWDILTSIWEEIVKEIKDRTGESWDLLAPDFRTIFKKPHHIRGILKKYGTTTYIFL